MRTNVVEAMGAADRQRLLKVARRQGEPFWREVLAIVRRAQEAVDLGESEAAAAIAAGRASGDPSTLAKLLEAKGGALLEVGAGLPTMAARCNAVYWLRFLEAAGGAGLKMLAADLRRQIEEVIEDWGEGGELAAHLAAGGAAGVGDLLERAAAAAPGGGR